MSLRLSRVSKRYADQLIFENVDFELHPGERVGLLGRNGSGKTTLMRALVGLEPVDAGQVMRLGRVAYLAQRGELEAGSLREAVLPEAHRRLRAELEAAEQALGEPTAANLERFAHSEEAFRVAGGYDLETRAEEVLAGLGLEGARSSEWLSGGQTRRALLARLLIEPAEFYLLDEPTNHLDLESIGWLEDWIRRSGAGFLIVSHDRAFLDATVTRCAELERQHIREYPGNYSQAMAWKRTEREAARVAFENHTRKLRALETEAQKASQRAGARMDRSRVRDNDKFAATFFHERGAQKASARARAIEKRIEQMGEVEKPFENRFITRIRLEPIPHGPKEVLVLEDVRFEREGRLILEHVNLHVRRGERVALLGPNGGGKSTLIAGVLEHLPARHGRIRRGVGLNIYWAAQNTEELDDFATLEEALLAANPDLETREIYALLASLGLPKEPLRSISSLSGGQRTRLSLARLSVTRAHLLILDEPTNNLDVDAIEALERMILGYTGTVIFASHDRRLIERVATRRLEVRDGRVGEVEVPA